jgi:hypothetical protein
MAHGGASRSAAKNVTAKMTSTLKMLKITASLDECSSLPPFQEIS